MLKTPPASYEQGAVLCHRRRTLAQNQCCCCLLPPAAARFQADNRRVVPEMPPTTCQRTLQAAQSALLPVAVPAVQLQRYCCYSSDAAADTILGCRQDPVGGEAQQYSGDNNSNRSTCGSYDDGGRIDLTCRLENHVSTCWWLRMRHMPV